MELTAEHYLSICSDLKNFGYVGEDSGEFFGEVLYIQLETPNGNRYRNRVSLDGVVFEFSEEGYKYPIDRRSEVNAYLGRQIDRITKAGRININNWVCDRPAYGSAAYQRTAHIFEDFGYAQT